MISSKLMDRAKEMFTEVSNGLVAVRVREYAGLMAGSEYDYVGVTYPNATSETYTFKAGGSSGTTVMTIDLVYTDSSKENLSSVTRN